MIKVLQFGNAGALYGAERWILTLIKHLNSDEVQTHVLSVRDAHGMKAPVCTEARKLGFPAVVIDCFGRMNLSAVDQVRQYILDNDIDIIHTHHYKTDIIGLLAVRGTHYRIVSTPHGWSKHVDIKLWCYEMLDRCIFPFMDAVVPLSDGLYRSVEKIPGIKRKLHYIQNGVDVSEVIEHEGIDTTVRSWKSDGALIIGYIGQLIPRKGLDVLIRAVSRLKGVNWKLVLVGDGEQRAELVHLAAEEGVADSIEFMGFRDDRLSFLKGFDMFVLPSRHEGIPRCLMEAMTAGVPVIASDIPGCNDLVSDRETGLLFPMDDEVRLLEAVEVLVNDKELGLRLSSNGRRLIDESYSPARMAREYTELYLRVMGGSKGGGQ